MKETVSLNYTEPMERLNQLFSARFKKLGFIPRKIAPAGARIALSGPPSSGKTHLLLNRALECGGTFLYLDLSDPRLGDAPIEGALEAFVREKRIAFLAVDHYYHGFVLPEGVPEIWVASTAQTAPAGFKTHQVWPLDFEEFLAFHRKADEPQALFNEFLRAGTLPETVGLEEFARIKRWREILRLSFEDRTQAAIYGWYLDRNGFSLSAHQAYTALKETMKLSKDRLYAFTQYLLDAGLLVALEKYEHAAAPRKLYAYDHALRQAVTFDKALSRSFEGMVAMELIKQGKRAYYADYVDVYLPDERRAVIAQAFPTVESLHLRAELIAPPLEARRIEFVTMGFEYRREEKNRLIEAVPFWEWALRESA